MPTNRHSDELKLKQTEQASEDRRAATLEYSRLIHERFLRDHNSSKEYAIMCLRSLFLVNGGAIIAILTLIGAVLPGRGSGSTEFTPASFVPAFESFGLGLVFAVLAMICGYFNFQFHGLTREDPRSLVKNIMNPPEGWPGTNDAKSAGRIKVTVWVAIIFAIASLAAFFCGGLLVRSVFLH